MSGLPTVNFEMGFTRTRMGYNWGTIFFMMGCIIRVHSLPSEMEGFVGKPDGRTVPLLEKAIFYLTF